MNDVAGLVVKLIARRLDLKVIVVSALQQTLHYSWCELQKILRRCCNPLVAKHAEHPVIAFRGASILALP